MSVKIEVTGAGVKILKFSRKFFYNKIFNF